MKAFYTIVLSCFCIGFSWSQNTSDIASLEYYFDQDPGVGLGTSIDINPDTEVIDQSFNISTTGLLEGTHKLFIRAINADGEASLMESKTFRITPTPDNNSSDIVEAEYFFNQDPGVGNGTAIDLMDAETIDEALSVSTSGLPTGTHRLFVRVKNSNDEYSLYEHKIFRVAPVSDINTASITAAEYYIDVDPGVGNGTTISVTGDSIDEVLSIPTTVGLAQGDHYLHIRVRNTDGTWSLYERQFFEVDGTLGITNEILSEIRIYPIPTAASVNIKTPNHVEITTIKLIDMYGKVIITTNGNLNKLDVSTLPKGTYLLQLITNEGNLSKRIIKN